jgi:hypothetical protein
MAMGLGAAKPRLAARRGSAAPQACDFTRRGAAGGRVSGFARRLGAHHVPDLRWEQIDFKTASLHVRRVKNGTPSTHPLTGRELRELRRIRGKARSRPSSSFQSAVRRFRRRASVG